MKSQISRNEAIDLVVLEIVGPNNLQSHPTFAKYESMEGQDTLWVDNYSDYLIAPFNVNWCFFIDLMPLANWAHDCQYVFVCAENADYEIIDHNYAPHPYFYNWNIFIEQWEWIQTVGVSEIKTSSKNIKIFPNPATDYIHIRLDKIVEGSIEVIIRDVAGISCHKQVIPSRASNEITIDVGRFPPGLYYLHIRTEDDNSVLQKLVIAH